MNKGDMRNAEGLLIAQAHTLNAIFNTLAQNAAAAEWMPHFEANLKLALRAQNQCRATPESYPAHLWLSNGDKIILLSPQGFLVMADTALSPAPKNKRDSYN